MINPKLKVELDEEISKHDPRIREFLTGDYFKHNFDLIARVNRLTSVESEILELEVILFLIGISDYSSIDTAIESELQRLESDTRAQVIADIKEYIITKSGYNQRLEVISSTDSSQVPNNSNAENKAKDQPQNSLDLRAQIVSNMTNKNIDDLVLGKKPEDRIQIVTEEKASKTQIVMPDVLATTKEESGQPLDPYLNRIDPVDKEIKKS